MEWLLFLILIGASVSICYIQAKKKRRNKALAIVLGLFLNVWAAIAYLVIPALPDSPPPRPDLEGYQSLRAGSIGAVVAVVSSLVVWGIARSLTGGEGDLGPGFAMLGVFAGALIAVSYLGIAAIWHGVFSLRQAREAGQSTRAGIGIALGVLDLGAAIGGVVVAAVVAARS